MGGRLSFSVALLDDAGDGLVLTSINGRTETRTYAKGVKGGTSEQSLSPEEEQAIGFARRGRTATHVTAYGYLGPAGTFSEAALLQLRARPDGRPRSPTSRSPPRSTPCGRGGRRGAGAARELRRGLGRADPRRAGHRLAPGRRRARRTCR